MTQFKEQLFIALVVAREGRGAAFDPRSQARHVNDVTKIVCEEWGHDEEPYFLPSPGAATLQVPDRAHLHTKCRRCGAVVTP